MISGTMLPPMALCWESQASAACGWSVVRGGDGTVACHQEGMQKASGRVRGGRFRGAISVVEHRKKHVRRQRSFA